MSKESVIDTIRAMFMVIVCFFVVPELSPSGIAQDEPALPDGLGSSEKQEEAGEKDEPSLPSGLESGQDSAEEEGQDEDPALPSGLDGGSTGEEEDETGEHTSLEDRLPFDASGFWEARAGTRLQPDDHQKTMSIGESRLQLDLQEYIGGTRLKLVSDFIYDPVADDHALDLNSGRGWLDLRQANVSFSPASFADVRLGRQVLTWGTGNYLFLNDLFPKDWKAFFIGRNAEYLKAPSDAIEVSTFSDTVNLDVVYIPRFNADRYIDGRRLSYWNSQLGRRAGEDAIVETKSRNQWFRDDEWAARLHKNVGSYELAAYGYHGYWKSPSGYDPRANKATFPELSAYGGSMRGPVLDGIGNVEVSYYDSREDRDGVDPNVPNSEIRFLVGYEREIAKNLTMGWQYYLEYMMEYDRYRESLPSGSRARDEDRHLVTFDVRQLLWNQNLELSMFTFYSPSDNDMYFRPKVDYQIDDNWSVQLGGNIFVGEHRHTFFNQFRDNTNVFVSVRYGF